ncbi:MAG: DUF6288 domain-containing protein, partial [Phycisphaeraceae bacterium]|nr:DUF6288 domain-containing protein [Phycisphaeraceae bacterium]
MYRYFSMIALVTGSLMAAVTLHAQPPVQPVTWASHVGHPSCHMNMGPTGARAWMRGYQFVITRIDRRSPADGVLELGDVVYGVNGKTFGPDVDPRMTLGHAIGETEASGQPLKLDVERKGQPTVISLTLPRLGAWGETWPIDCEKSRRVLRDACRALLPEQLPSGQVITDGDLGTSLGGLLWLASADPAFLDAARRAAYRTAAMEFDEQDRPNNWTMGYGGLLLAEYYLATGDDNVLPGLQTIVNRLVDGQMTSGGWGHKSPAGAYGTLNQPGLTCAIALTLADECGVDVDPTRLKRAQDFFRRFAELGVVPYGDHMPWNRLPDDNGRNAQAAVLMHVADRHEPAAVFAETASLAYWAAEAGHTGGFFSIAWGPLGAALSGEENFRTYMDYQSWYYNLARTWRGHLVMLPYREALTRFDNNFYISAGGRFTTGGIGLVFALPQQHLQILGAPTSIFSDRATPEVDLKTAREHYLARRWAACDQALAAIDPQALADDQRQWFDQLQACRQRMESATDRVVLEMESNLIEDGPVRAQSQLKALQRRLGDVDDPRLAAIQSQLDQKEWHLREGAQFYEAWTDLRSFAVKTWVPQGNQLRRMLDGVPTPYLPIWEPLSPASSLTPQSWRTFWPGLNQSLPENWHAPDFDDSAWAVTDGIHTAKPFPEPITREGPLSNVVAARRTFHVTDPRGARLRVRLQTVRPTRTRVFLNGALVADVLRGKRGGYADIELDASALEILKAGDNLLAVSSDQRGGGNNRLDVALDINRVHVPTRPEPPQRAQTIRFASQEDLDVTLRVHEVKQEQAERYAAIHRDMDTARLLDKLGDPIAWRRNLTVTTLADRGREAVTAVVDRLHHDDWIVRSAACEVIEHAAGDDEVADTLAAAVPKLRQCLQDPHFWVRTRAAFALRRLGDTARTALPELLECVTDPDPWVRIAALRAVREVHERP